MNKGNAFNTISSFLMIVFVLNLTTGCFYYRVNTKTDITADDIRWEDFNKKYFILHSIDTAWHLNNLSVDHDVLNGNINPLPSNHQFYKRTNPETSNIYSKSKRENVVLQEVHLYANVPLKPDSNRISCNVESLTRMEVYYLDQGKTAATHAIPVIVIPIAVLGIIGIIIALTKSSCPYVYVLNDQGYQFIGEIYSGAIYSSLERDDYLSLPGINPVNDEYQVKIANELPEIQYIDKSELWVVDHPAKTKVMPDKNGDLHTINSPLSPVQATTSGKSDITGTLEKNDDLVFSFNEEPSLTGNTDAKNSVVLDFEVPTGQTAGKLVVKAKNSYWGDYVSGEFIKLFGNRYKAWVKKQSAADPDSIYQWRNDQALPLMIYIETSRGWEFVDYFHLTGPLAFREMIMPIDFTKYFPEGTMTGPVKIKLETGFMFWEIDYASLDISTDQSVDLQIVPISSATNESGKNVRKLLIRDERKYYVQPDIGDEVYLAFDPPPVKEGCQRSVLLHAKGYYNHVRYFNDDPNKEELVKFRQPGKLSEFSYEKFRSALYNAKKN